ncbi:hypothetical protein KF913_00045 [Candidatus Obscuribacterales bacterium]|nr:hypothetical protein [Candidatus Obscuribacterales bacterium]
MNPKLGGLQTRWRPDIHIKPAEYAARLADEHRDVIVVVEEPLPASEKRQA